MGQKSSSCTSSVSEEFLSFPVELVQDDLLRHARIFTEIAGLSYDHFVKQLGELNRLTKKCLDSNGKQLIFAVKKGTDSTILWKGTVRIGCVKIDPATSSVESYRLINLAEFLQVFKTLQGHVDCMEANKKKSESLCPSTSEDVSQIPSMLTASMIIDHVDGIDKCKNFDRITECCICLERKPEVSLPCTHSYCLPCIEQWNVNNKTCPICRERLETTNDTWIISDAPDTDEIVAEICSNLDELSQLSPKHQMK